MRFGEFIFYDADSMSIAEKLSMFRDCVDLAYEWHADTLDCSVSVARKHFECSFEEILGHLKDDSYVVVINRGIWGSPFGEDREHFEVGFSTKSSSVEYFLFIQIDSNRMPPILEKYKLNPIST